MLLHTVYVSHVFNILYLCISLYLCTEKIVYHHIYISRISKLNNNNNNNKVIKMINLAIIAVQNRWLDLRVVDDFLFTEQHVLGGRSFLFCLLTALWTMRRKYERVNRLSL